MCFPSCTPLPLPSLSHLSGSSSPMHLSHASNLEWIFVNLTNMCLGVFSLWLILIGSLGFLDLRRYFLPHLGEVFSYYLPSIFSWPFFVSSSSGTPLVRMLGHFTLAQRSLRLSSFLLILFFSFPLCFIYFHQFIFYLTYPIFCLCYSTVGSLQSVFDLIYCIIHFQLTLFYFF